MERSPFFLVLIQLVYGKQTYHHFFLSVVWIFFPRSFRVLMFCKSRCPEHFSSVRFAAFLPQNVHAPATLMTTSDGYKLAWRISVDSKIRSQVLFNHSSKKTFENRGGYQMENFQKGVHKGRQNRIFAGCILFNPILL